jgi:TrmH family RNA methyltransferase
MTIRQLTSKENPLLKTMRLVSSCSRRAPKHLVVAEGIRVLEEVCRADCAIEAIVFSEHFGSTSRDKTLMDVWQSAGLPVYQCSEKLLASVSSVKTPQGAIALVRVPEHSLSEAVPSPNPLIVYACGIQDPGNLGTLIRTAAAAGACLACTTKGTVSPKNPKSIRSSAGTFFRLPIFEHVEVSDFERYCSLHSIQPYRTDAHAGVPYTEANLQSPCAILLGNESNGVQDEELARFPAIRIPMAEGIDSLNVAVAGAVILFEAFRSRQNP